MPQQSENKNVARILSKGEDKPVFYETTQTRNGVREQALAFKVIFENGRQQFIQYHELVSPFSYDGSGLIELTTPLISVRITGKNLQKIFDFLGEHHIRMIKEPDGSLVPVGEGEPEIEKIEVSEV